MRSSVPVSDDEDVESVTGADLYAQALARLPVAQVAAAAAAVGAEVYLVGGPVRDLLMGRPLVDIDLATDAAPEALAHELGLPFAAATRFGTLNVTDSGFRYDIARTRSERYRRPGALPEVQPADIQADLRRRDFTVNAMALGLAGPRTGELLTVPGALRDLEQRRLSVLHDQSFRDDPTRLLRLARYCARLRFEPTAHTRDLVTEAVAAGALRTISGPRLGNELRLLSTESDPLMAFSAVADLGLPWRISDQPAARRALSALPDDGRSDLLTLACVFAAQFDAGGESSLRAELDRLGFTSTDRETIEQILTRAGGLAKRLDVARSPAEIAAAVGSSVIETVAMAAALGSGAQAQTWLNQLRQLRLQISGDDLIACGLSEGPAIGRALAAARAALLDGEATDRETQLRAALTAAS